MIYTEEQKAELMSNPYTAHVGVKHITFTLEFKKFVMANVGKTGMTSRKLFRLAGYRDELATDRTRQETILAIKREAASPKGLQEPKVRKKDDSRKKHTATELKELQERVLLLEQQIEFLKKSHHLNQTDQ